MIHALFCSYRNAVWHVDGRIKSGHDEWGLSAYSYANLPELHSNLNRAAVVQALAVAEEVHTESAQRHVGA